MFGHVPRRDSKYISRMILRFGRGRQEVERKNKKRLIDFMVCSLIGVREEDAEDMMVDGAR